MKRFYKLVSFEEKPEGHCILLDGRAVKTKSGSVLYAPNKEIASEVVTEWSSQKEIIDPDTMPFTQILSTKIDQVRVKREAMSAAIIKYLNTDLVCYLAESPEALVNLQEEKWKKFRDWIQDRFGHPVMVTNGLFALSQCDGLHKNITSFVNEMDDDRFTVFQIAVPVTGSIILGLALMEQQACASEIHEACFIEEKYKDQFYMTDFYGHDPHTEKKQKDTLKDLDACERFLSHL